MKKLVIHQFTNHFSKRFRYYNIFWDELVDKLSKKHEVVADRYKKTAHMGYNNVTFEMEELSGATQMPMLECEMIIENITDKEVHILSVSDDLTPAILNMNYIPEVKTILVSQFIREKIYHHVSDEYRGKYSPWIYFPSNDFDLDRYYYERKLKNELIEKMYFRGSASYRPILNYFSDDVFHGGDSIGGFDTYAKELINYSVSLSLAGRGELCYRDIECMAMGIPLLRFQYLSEMKEPLVPNKHYISVERPEDLRSWSILDREGNSEHASLLTEKFLSVIKEKDFLRYISENAREYYNNYLSPKSSVDFTIKLLKL